MGKVKSPQLRKLVIPAISSEPCQNASLVLKRAHDSSSALLKAFDLLRETRGKPRGRTTDEEQDLLRAMLVMAASGLDAMAKQLTRDALPALVEADKTVRDGLETFIERKIRDESESPGSGGGRKFVARVLAAASRQEQVIGEYITKLTAESLQSYEQLAATASALGLPLTALGVSIQGRKQELMRIFAVRNKVVHELDMNLEGYRSKRNRRGLEDMIRYTEVLLEVAENMLAAVEQKLVESAEARPRTREPLVSNP